MKLSTDYGFANRFHQEFGVHLDIVKCAKKCLKEKEM